jgi:membrane-bound serine protease (ClpP class)
MKYTRIGMYAFFAFASFVCSVFGSAVARADNHDPAGTVAVIHVDRTIETGLQRFMERAFAEAEATGAETIVLVIDTFGGRVDAAAEIGELIRTSPLRTVAYVQGKAISAGSYIALNADEIYMHEGSMIGAAAVVDVSGERVKDSKVISMWVGAMKSAAEANGRNPQIAIGMVDDTVRVKMPEINRTKEPGELITLTAKEASSVGYAEGVVTSLKQVMETIGAERQETVEPTLAEELARFLTHPATTTILFILGIAGLLIELLVPGFGVPGIVGVSSFALYFLGNYAAGFAGVEHLALFIAGVLFLVLELFIPSFGILGVLGIISLISGVILAAYDTGNALTSLGIAVLVSSVIVTVFVRYFKHRGVWNRFILRDALKTEEGYVSHKSRGELIGKTGRAVTPLRPAGTIVIEDERIDVVTNGEFIAAGTNVMVVQLEGIRVVVKEASPPKGE